MFCLKSVPAFKVVNIQTVSVNLSAAPLNVTWSIVNPDNTGPDPHDIFFYTEFICNGYFTLELIIRLFVTPNIIAFFKSPINVIDFLALVSFYFYVILVFMKSALRYNIYIETFSIVRLFRIFKLTRHISGLKILILTFQASMKELILLMFFLFVFIVVFAAFIYYVEKLDANNDSPFTSIIDGLWWALITMTTVGFGDYVPKSYYGNKFNNYFTILECFM